MKIGNTLITCIIWCLVTFHAAAAYNDNEILQVDVMTCIDTALRNNPGLLMDRLTADREELNNRYVYCQRFRPDITLTLQPPDYTNSVYQFKNDDGLTEFVTLTETSSKTRFNLDQPLLYQGSMSFSVDQFYIEEKNQDVITKDSRTTIALGITQPFFKDDPLKHQAERADLNLQYQNKNLQQKINDLIYRVTEQYYTCVKTLKQIEIDTERLNQSLQSLDIARKKFNSGLIPEAEVLNLEVSYGQEKVKLSSSENSLQSQKDRLKNIMGMDLMSSISLDTSINVTTRQYSLDNLIIASLQNRPEIIMQDIKMQLIQSNLNELRRSNRPYGQIYGDIALDSQGEDFSESFKDFQETGKIGVNFVVPIWDGGKKNIKLQQMLIDVEKTRIETDIAKRDITLQVKEAFRNLTDAENRIRILESNLKVAEKNNFIAQERFELGSINSQELLDSQIALNGVQTSYLQALVDYKIAVAYLKKVTLHEPVQL